ncbi:TPA: winged helix-turn-helix transcriptional regulator [Enterobacter ludwigii]|uniref:MarR family winged helix-turn-helix transcriptional regulator n=1 Tax=Enterobacter TaxID=547 RepID=UPI002FD76208|nr:winged helix-turn-helix transcriptional regulator [Enterobacter ludwigii]HDR2600519.1 winged helix-turn-helix transcriptional regulator [Enterobacter ludwigii]
MHNPSTDLVDALERLNRLHHDFRNEVNNALINHGLTLSKVRVLKAIEEHEACNATEVMAVLSYSCRSVTESLESLEVAGLITRHKTPGNRKVKIISLTEQGQDRLHLAMQVRNDILTTLLSCLEGSELVLFRNIINKIWLSHGQNKHPGE